MSHFQREISDSTSVWQKNNKTSLSTRTSLVQYISSGIPSIDSILGGGIAAGSVTLIEEDLTGSYAEIIFKYFVSAGVLWCPPNGLFACSTKDVGRIMKELPGVATAGERELGKPSDNVRAEELKIAWQYKDLPKVRSCTSAASSPFDLTTAMDAEVVAAANPRIMSIDDFDENRCLYTQLIRQLHGHVEKQAAEAAKSPGGGGGGGGGTETSSNNVQNVSRIGLLSIGSPLWDGHPNNRMNFCEFLYHLRALTRSSNSTCLLTVPVHLAKESFLVKRMEKLCDAVILLESFDGSAKETNPIFKDYQGLVHLLKVPTLNTLNRHRPPTNDFAFKLRRRKFTVEVLHLPPELPETTNRSQEDSDDVPSAGVGCGAKSKIDF